MGWCFARAMTGAPVSSYCQNPESCGRAPVVPFLCRCRLRAATIFSIGRMERSVLAIRFFRSDMNELRDLAGQVYYGNTLRNWAIALIVFVLLFTVLPLIRAVIRNRFRKLRPQQSRATLEIVVAVMNRTTRLFLIAVAIWLSTRSLTIPSRLDRALDVALLVIIWFQ